MQQEDSGSDVELRQLSPAERAELRQQLRSEWNARHASEAGSPDPGATRADGAPPRRGWNLPFPWREPRR